MSTPQQATDSRANVLYELQRARAGALEALTSLTRARDCVNDPVRRDILALASCDAQSLAHRIDRLVLRVSREPQ